MTAGDAREATTLFGSLAKRYRDRSDLVTAFALSLWEAFAARRAGLLRLASRAHRNAAEIERTTLIRLSPNWWAAEVCGEPTSPTHGPQGSSRYPVASKVSHATATQVTVCGSRIRIEGADLPAGVWQQRTGSRVRQRMFQILVNAHPSGVERTALIDALWPDSDGDHAVANFYGATKGLRRVLAGVPGLRLAREGDALRLEAAPNVRFG